MTARWEHSSAFAARLARWWARCYTTGLTSQVRERRLTQLESDLWEHGYDRRADGAAAALIGTEILGRVLRGVPADVLWRFQREGPVMHISIPLERIMGAMLIGLAVMVVISTSIAGYDTSADSWASELARLRGIERWQTDANAAFFMLTGLGLVVTGASLGAAFRRTAPIHGVLAGVLLAGSGVLTMVAAALYAVVAELAHETPEPGPELLATSRAVALAMDGASAGAALCLVMGAAAVAAGAVRSGFLGRWAMWVAVPGAVLSATAAVLQPFELGEATWMAVALGLMLSFAWLLVAGFMLVLGRPGPGAPAGQPA